MRLHHPVSFFLMMVIMVSTAALSVVWSFAHMIAVVVVIGLIPLLRWTSHREGRKKGTT